MKTHLNTNDQQGATWHQRVVDRLRKVLRPRQWLLARDNTTTDGIDGGKAVAHQRRSVVFTVRRSDQLGASASYIAWSERRPQALALIPIRIAAAQLCPRGRSRHRHE